jgi:hypothetical protein
MQAMPGAEPSWFHLTLEIDVLTAVVAGIAVAVGIWQYRKAAYKEFVKPIQEAQLAIYQQVCAAAADLATLKSDSKEWKKAHAEYLLVDPGY